MQLSLSPIGREFISDPTLAHEADTPLVLLAGHFISPRESGLNAVNRNEGVLNQVVYMEDVTCKWRKCQCFLCTVDN